MHAQFVVLDQRHHTVRKTAVVDDRTLRGFTPDTASALRTVQHYDRLAGHLTHTEKAAFLLVVDKASLFWNEEFKREEHETELPIKSASPCR